MWVYTSLNTEETLASGRTIGARLPNNSVVAFQGDLGAGKTLLIKGLAKGAADIDPALVQSPTFVLLNIYEGTRAIYHFDLYRLRDADAFLSMGFDDYFFQGGVSCVEWSERISEVLPAQVFRISIAHLGGDLRRIEIPLSQFAMLQRGRVDFSS